MIRQHSTRTDLKIISAVVFFGVVALVVFWQPLIKSNGGIQWDAIGVHFFNLQFSSNAIHNGHLPLWTPYLFNGFPQIADLQVGIFYPPNLLLALLTVFSPRLLLLQIILHYILAGLGASVLVYYFSRNYFFSIAAGLAYAFGGYMVGHATHVGMLNAGALLPWLFFVTIVGIKTKRLYLAPMAGFIFGCVILAGHFQSALYAGYGVGLYLLYEVVRLFLSERLWRKKLLAVLYPIVFVCLIYFLGLGISAVQLLPSFQLTQLSQRANLNLALSQTESLYPSSLVSMLDPNFRGVISQNYNGPWDRTQNYLFISRSLLILALMGGLAGLFIKGRRFQTSFWLVFICINLLYAFGQFSFVQPIFFKFVPLFNKIRAPANIFPLINIALIILAAFAIRDLRDLSKRRNWNLSFRVLGLLILALIFVEIIPTVHKNNLLYGAASPSQIVAIPPIYQQVQKDYQGLDTLHQFKVFRVTSDDDNSSQYFGIYNFEGYNPLALSRQADYTDAMVNNPSLVDLAGIKYLPCEYISARPNLPKVLDFCVNDKYFPRAFFVNKIVTTNDPKAVLNKLLQIDPSKIAVVEGDSLSLNNEPASSVASTVSITSADINSWHIQTNTMSQAFLVLSQSNYPGWRVFIDGKESNIYQADYLFQGLLVPAGEHQITLVFTSPKLLTGAIVSLIAALVLLISSVITFVYRRQIGYRLNIMTS